MAVLSVFLQKKGLGPLGVKWSTTSASTLGIEVSWHMSQDLGAKVCRKYSHNDQLWKTLYIGYGFWPNFGFQKS